MITARKIMPKNTEGAAATVKWGRLIEAVATRRIARRLSCFSSILRRA